MNLKLEDDPSYKLGYLQASVERALGWLQYERGDNYGVERAAKELEIALAKVAEKTEPR